MPPLINGPAATGAAGAGNAPELHNPELQAIQDQIERNLTPENRVNYNKIVVAGLHLALDNGVSGVLAGLHNSRDPVADAAKGAVSLMLIMRQEAHGVMPLKAAVPAAMTLLLKALDFLERSRVITVDQSVIERAGHIFGDFVLARFGISKDGLANAATQVHQWIQNPQVRQQLQAKAQQQPGQAAAGAAPVAALPAM